MIFINFKTSNEGIAQNALELINEIKSLETGVETIPVVIELDAFQVRQVYEGKIWLQHADSEEDTTGRTSIKVISGHRGLSIDGVFLNHSEHKYHKFEALQKTVNDCKKYSIRSLVFASDLNELDQALSIQPSFVAYEPPELVGSKNTSVATEKPEIIEKAAAICNNFGVPLIVGAGIKSKKDVEVSKKLGAVGVAVSSAVVKAQNPKVILNELISGFKL